MDTRFSILVVDDEPVNILLMTSALEETYEIFTALNGLDAIIKCKQYMPDLILLDVMMPDLSGFDVCRSIKSDAAFVDIPIIFLTALDSAEGQLQGLDLGGIDYLTKPVNLDLLTLRVRNHIELKKRNDLVKEQRNLLARQKEELEAAFIRIKRLEGIIPICMYCKGIRKDDTYWQQIESYISDHTNALFSPEVCPACAAQNQHRHGGYSSLNTR
jgi:DNA-binding response OmpR family regulator